ncbi:hypothetical protein DHEL01_v211077 [Diaporthe helianthi]|uniref:non-specific serine/threonine protein kinase n=1 Tax=Diaporthe helianthi TaxID=158607 RepID=A0A2P5HJY6_DIAHE|nr:hypothetical protein DHEL01_v211077 [Diaporthe helianthi]
MSRHDPPEAFRPQNLRSYIASYAEIAVPACIAAERVTRTAGTEGPINNPEGRRTPQLIIPCTASDLSEERAVIDAILHATDDVPLFLPAKRHVEHVGEELVLVDSESALLLYDANTLHAPATRILRDILASERTRILVAEAIQPPSHQAGSLMPNNKLRPGNVTFPTHKNSVPRNMSGTKRNRDDDPYKRILGESRFGPADVFSIFKPALDAGFGLDEDSGQSQVSGQSRDTGESTSAGQLLFVKEAKAPHKLTAKMIDKAVGQSNKILDPKAIMSHGYPAPSTDESEPSTAESEFWFAAVCSQLYSSMVYERLRFGVITTGMRFVFLTLDPETPAVLQYSISQNTPEIYESPLLRIVSLALRAIQNGQLREGNCELHRILEGRGLIWRTGVRNEYSNSGNEEEKAYDTKSYAPPSDQGRTSDSGVSDSHALQTTSASQYPHPQHTTSSVQYPYPPQDTSSVLGKRCTNDEAGNPAYKRRQQLDGAAWIASFIPPRPTTPISVEEPPENPDVREIPYCSAACLQSVMGGSDGAVPDDPLCPNHVKHKNKVRSTGDAIRHFIKDRVTNRPEVYDIYHPENHLNHVFMGMSPESDSVVYKLEVHGYVFLGKAFQPGQLKGMYREDSVYQRMKSIQGKHVPVCLGVVKFTHRHPLRDCYSGIGYGGLLLLGYGGRGYESWGRLPLAIAGHTEKEVDHMFAQELTAQVQKALARVHRAGVLHKDVALRNILVRKASVEGEAGSEPRLHVRVSLIDFERSGTRSKFRRKFERHNTDGGMEGKTNAGEVEFAQKCDEEMRSCHNIGSQWLSYAYD